MFMLLKILNRIRRASDITWIEALIVAVVAVALAILAVPTCGGADQAREAVLKTNLRTMRAVIAQYRQDTGSYPETLEELVDEGFLRHVPIDPMTGNSEGWELIVFDPCVELSIVDVRSGAPGSGLDGTLYRRW